MPLPSKEHQRLENAKFLKIMISSALQSAQTSISPAHLLEAKLLFCLYCFINVKGGSDSLRSRCFWCLFFIQSVFPFANFQCVQFSVQWNIDPETINTERMTTLFLSKRAKRFTHFIFLYFFETVLRHKQFISVLFIYQKRKIRK